MKSGLTEIWLKRNKSKLKAKTYNTKFWGYQKQKARTERASILNCLALHIAMQTKYCAAGAALIVAKVSAGPATAAT